MNFLLVLIQTILAVDSEYGIYLVDGTYLTLYEHNFGIDYLNNLMMEQERVLSCKRSSCIYSLTA